MELFTLLPNIKSPADIKTLSYQQLAELADEIRRTIIEVVGHNGGHLASNLGVVELTIALHRVFDSPNDAIVWDVSHQCYAHKLLTGRYERFYTLRQYGGLSGFTKKNESHHDFFDEGHSSTSISCALGLLTAWQLQGKNNKVVAVIGDGALTGGMSMEALSNAGQLSKNLIIVLNDNQMSIDQNTGAISRYLSRISATSPYQNFKRGLKRFISKIPFLSKVLLKFFKRFKRSFKGLVLSTNLFADLDCEYVGPLDGHDIRELENVFTRVKKLKKPVVVHILTKKGKGYSPAEDHPELFHGIGPFCISDGKVEKFDNLSFTECFSNELMNLAQVRKNIVCITAAMSKGTGLDSFARHYPERFFDVGIAEEHAVTFAGGLAEGGMLPFVCIYSTFMQRAVDQVIHDIALQNVHVVILLDRAGAVPGDGETHQGLFDIALFRPVPGIKILSPATAQDLKYCLEYAVNSEGAIIIRYPKMTCPKEQIKFSAPIEEGKGVLVKACDFESTLTVDLEENKNTPRILFVTTGGMYSECITASRALALEYVLADIYSLRFITPIDEKYLLQLCKKYDGIIFVEDGVEVGGVSQYLHCLCLENGIKKSIVKAFPSKFYSQGTREQVCMQACMTCDDLKLAALSLAKIKSNKFEE